MKSEALPSQRTAIHAFSRTAVDHTLEQSVNADAASRTTGIAAFTTSVSARTRWMVTRSVRSCIIGTLMEKTGLNSHEDTSKELTPYQIQKYMADLAKVTDGIESRMNPFAIETDNNLYCLTTGKSIP